jgi:hypothetical protein
MLLCDNCNGGYHLFCIKPELIQVFPGIWYCSSCSPATPWFLLRPCHVFIGSSLGGDTWEFHLNLLFCIVYICACISFWLISFYLWLVLVFLFNRVYYGFTPLRHRTSRHYTSRHYSQILLNLVVDIIVSLATSQNWKSKPWDSPHVWKIVDPQKAFECWKYKSNNTFFLFVPNGSHHVPLRFLKFLSCSKTFPIAPHFYPIWFAQSSTLMCINWEGMP